MLTVLLLTVAFSSFYSFLSVSSGHFNVTTVDHSDQMVKYLVDLSVTPLKTHPNEFKLDLRPIYARFFPKGYQQVLLEEEKSESHAMLTSWITSTFHHRVSIELRLITDQTPTGLLEVSIDDCSNVSTTAVSCPSLLSWSNSHRSLINITSLFRYTWQYPLHIVVKLNPTDSQAGLKVSSIAVHLEIIAAECTKRISAEETLCISEPHCRQECGHYAFVQTASKDSLIAAIVSPYYSHTGDGCQLQFKYRIRGVAPSEIVVAVQPLLDSDRVGTGTLAGQIHPKSAIVSKWTNYTVNIGKMLKPMRIKIEAEVVRGQNLQMNLTADVMIDDIELTNCGEILYQPDKCAKNSTEVYRCSSSKLCIPLDEVCDLFPNCFGGEDEDLALHNCSQVPLGARCTFEEGMCGWVSEPASFRWVRVNVSNGQLLSEPNGHTDSRLVFDHTYKNHSGHFMYAELGEGIRMETARLVSPKFPPTPKNLYEEGSPLYNQCKLRFFYNHLGRTWHSVTLWQYTDTGRTKLWAHENEMSSNSEDMDPWDWERVSLVIPYTDSDYNLTFAAIRMALYKGNFGIDDFSITPQCFSGDMSLRDHTKVAKMYNFSTCGATGIYGPTQKLCTTAYNKTSAKVIIDRGVRPGLQKWKVPMTGEYKIVAGGASGGVIDNRSGDVHNFGAEVTGVVQLQKDSHLLLAVGQMGESPCEYRRPFKRDAAEKYRTLATLCSPGLKTATSPVPISLESLPGAGGGGGSFVVYLTRGAEELLISAAGGGGLFAGGNNDEHSAGRQMNTSVVVKDSKPHEKGPAGNGGSFSLQAEDNMTGGSWAEHLRGGLCGSEAFWDFSGGFGGGGAACGPGGGGGGGHTGGQGGNFTSGLGGRSYSIAPRSPIMREAQFGHGYILIYSCLLQCPTASVCRFKADSQVCVCTTGQIVNEKRGEKCPQDASANNAIQSSFLPSKDYLMAIIICIVLLLVAFMFVIVYVVCHYRNARHKYLQKEATNNELPMRNFPGSNFHTEYNPNYDFSCNLKELNEIPRTCVTLIKALGQGAFGEVFEGVLNNVADELNNLPIAVKSLPEFATEQAQLDFCMEALIMSKFHHPNIVRFIGVCFDKMPRLIILELLAGGDLKTFLRENRPKIDNPSRLTMTDLLQMACDVAKGCQYLEDNHFIHRDIAARNCLLTSKDPGRIVKIADFGMARDIYRADYYRKGGKAMLPVKWMPPEAFLDGIFTSKTDVWSYGVLLWEIFSLGYMPYPGRGNQEVMQLVTAGGRLEPPHGCPTQVYQIMTQCWHTIAEERPRFATIIERLGYCIQDPDICDAPLMVFQRQQTVEREISSSNRTSLSDVQPVAKPTNIHTPEPLPTKGSGVTSCFYPPYNPRSQDYLLPLGSPKQSAGSTSDCPSDLLLVPSRSTATTSLGTPTPSFGGILGSNMIPLQTGDLDDDVFSPLNAQKLFDSHQQPPCEPHVVLRKNLND